MEDEGNMTPEELAIKNVGKQVRSILVKNCLHPMHCLIGSKASLGREGGCSYDNQHSAMSGSHA